jgi:hypothetical protein
LRLHAASRSPTANGGQYLAVFATVQRHWPTL